MDLSYRDLILAKSLTAIFLAQLCGPLNFISSFYAACTHFLFSVPLHFLPRQNQGEEIPAMMGREIEGIRENLIPHRSVTSYGKSKALVEYCKFYVKTLHMCKLKNKVR